MVSSMLSFAIFLILFIYPNGLLSKNSEDFGPYDSSFNEYDLCRGPKGKNLTVVNTEIIETNGEQIGLLNLTFVDRTQLEEIKIVVYSWKGNTKSILWSYNLKDPCQHFMIAALIESKLNSHNCIVEKGDYPATVNFSDTLKTLLGPSFFYGEYSLKATVLSKKGNILCILTSISISKKKESKEKKN